MSPHDLNYFLGGAIFLGEFAIAVMFVRSWRHTGDRLFAWFAAAFALLACERVLLAWTATAHHHPAVYLTRLGAFLLIIFAVIDRNRAG